MKAACISILSLWFILSFSGGVSAQSCSTLLETGLSPEQVELLRSHSKGLISFEQWDSSSSHEGVLLGIFGEDNRYESLVAKWKMTSWESAYKRFGIQLGESQHTEKFMDTLTRLGEPIVFLVPSKLWIHPMGVITKREMWWLLSHPERMKNVLFVIDLPPSSQ